MTETHDLRRAESAVAAYGVTAFLLALIYVLDAMRFHGDVLVDSARALVAGHPQAGGVLLLSLAVFDAIGLSRILLSIGRGAGSHRRLAHRLPVLEQREIAGRRVRIVPGAQPLAFCAGLVRPRVYVSRGALARLGARELTAVVAHEGHHAARRDPLRFLVARAIGDAYRLRTLPFREEALAELSADAAAVRRGGAAPLAAALLAFEAVAPERVDRLVGTPPRGDVPRALVGGAAFVVLALVVCLGACLLVPGNPRFCLPLASAPGWIVLALTARLVAMAPAWLGWRRAGAFLA